MNKLRWGYADGVLRITNEEYSIIKDWLAKPHGEADVASRYGIPPFADCRVIVHRSDCRLDWITVQHCTCGAEHADGKPVPNSNKHQPRLEPEGK